MEYRGNQFRTNKSLVSLPIYDEEKNCMPYVEDGHENYIYFGKVIPRDKKKPINAIKTTYTWRDTGESVFAIPVKLNGHSRTNMAYGDKNQIYLYHDGQCYQAKIQRI